jgi:hypothetical protein
MPMKATLGSYLGFLLRPFFRWWWAVVTGLASLLSLLKTPTDGWTVTPVGAFLLTFGASTLLFLVLSVCVQGWQLFTERWSQITVATIQRTKDLAGDWAFVLTSQSSIPVGSVIDIHRKLGDVEVPFAMVQVVKVTTRGDYQAVPIVIAAAHIRDYALGKFTVADLDIHGERVRDVGNEITEPGQ